MVAPTDARLGSAQKQMDRAVVEPKHRCTNRCTFAKRRCKATGNYHACSHSCTVLNGQGHYVCTLTGIISATLPPRQNPPATRRKPCRHPATVGPNQKKIANWLREAIRAFLFPSDVRTNLRKAALKRSVVKIKRIMGNLPWCARRLAAADCQVKRLSVNSLNRAMAIGHVDEFVDWLSTELLAYLFAFAVPLFKPTRTGIGTFAAVMISAMATGVKDAGTIWIIEKHDLVEAHCPSPIDFPKLAAGMTSCKAMSTGYYAIKNLALSQKGQARKRSLFRPSAFSFA